MLEVIAPSEICIALVDLLKWLFHAVGSGLSKNVQKLRRSTVPQPSIWVPVFVASEPGAQRGGPATEEEPDDAAGMIAQRGWTVVGRKTASGPLCEEYSVLRASNELVPEFCEMSVPILSVSGGCYAKLGRQSLLPVTRPVRRVGSGSLMEKDEAVCVAVSRARFCLTPVTVN